MKIVVIEAWGLHLGYLGCYGNDWTATPNLDRLAAEGIVFDWHYADQPELESITPWPERSVATGRYALPGDTPVRLDEGMPRPKVVRCESVGHFAERALSAVEGADPWIWIEGPSLLPPWNLHEEMARAYFDEDDEGEGLVPWLNPPLEVAPLSEAELVELQNTYAAMVTFFDAQLGSLLDCLREKRILDDALICVTARSGLPLGEHGMIGTPRPNVNDEMVHVPLVIRLPAGREAGLRIQALTQTVDLMPTFCETLAPRSDVTTTMHGRSLWPLLRGEVDELRPYVVTAMRVGTRESRMLRTRDWALHVHQAAGGDGGSTTLQLFAKPEDRWEVNDLYQQQVEAAEHMQHALQAFDRAIRQPGPLTCPLVGR